MNTKSGHRRGQGRPPFTTLGRLVISLVTKSVCNPLVSAPQTTNTHTQPKQGASATDLQESDLQSPAPTHTHTHTCPDTSLVWNNLVRVRLGRRLARWPQYEVGSEVRVRSEQTLKRISHACSTCCVCGTKWWYARTSEEQGTPLHWPILTALPLFCGFHLVLVMRVS